VHSAPIDPPAHARRGASAPGGPARGGEPRRRLHTQIAWLFFGSAAAVAAVSALLIATLPLGLPADRRTWIAAALAAVALLALPGLRARRDQVDLAMAAFLVGATLVIAVTAVLGGWGLASPGLPFFGLFVCVLAVSGRRSLGWWLAGVTVLAVLAVDAASRWWPRAGGIGPDDGLRLAVQLMLIASGLASGLMLSKVQSRFIRAAADREQRFRGLLAIAADAYWEIDASYRLVSVSNPRDPLQALGLDDGIGMLPWELPQFECDAERLDGLQADLESRLPFHDVPVRWYGTGEPRWIMVSGEPRFDPRGVFRGYWGVARDISSDVAARQALNATETRYQELFARIPTPLVLQRHGRIVDANPAGVSLFGQPDLAALLGTDLLAGYQSGDSRERERRRLETLDTLPVGEALPVADFSLRLTDGRRVSVRSTSVRVDAEGGPATLTIYVDDTERRSAEEAVRRSETMLSHLVATSPDVITLTDLSTGRYVMVNQTFERVMGYRMAEVVGRTSIELGVWDEPHDRARFIEQLRERGSATDVPTRFRSRSGQAVLMRVSGARFVMDRRDYLVINARDITETERARLEREAILESALIGIAVTQDRRFTLANPYFEQLFGWPRGGLIGQPGQVVWASAQEYAALGERIGPALARGEAITVEGHSRRKDGSTFLSRVIGKPVDPRYPMHGGTLWIVEDITERRQVEQALAAARDEAEAASRAKSAFLANTSHELRTPLNGILNLAQLARADDIDDARRRRYLDQIAESSLTLAAIISDILDLSKIEAGKLGLESTTFDLGELLAGLQRAYAMLTAERRLQLTLDVHPQAQGAVSGDPLRVRQILGNFLGNAVKFTAAGEVRLLARRVEGTDRVRFEVHDTGPGIDADTCARLFQPFTQADQSTTRRFGGTGLGLSICRELATLMHGEVGVASTLGSGSRFWAELPLPAAAAPPAPAADLAAPSPPASAPAADLHGARVLMVEDNPVNMMIAVAMLERWGVRVAQTVDGAKAVDAVQRAAAEGRPFDAVLMDVQMPVMSGHEATRVLRQSDAGRAVPIIALTAAAMVSEREQALAVGMDDFLTKPIDSEKLRITLTKWVLGGRFTPSAG
jgi:PAS domain S-box-containing protein